MTIEISIANFRGAMLAKLQCSPIALVAGMNAVGKSSVCQAIGAAATGVGTHLVEPSATVGKWSQTIKKADAGLLVARGHSNGKCEVSGAQGSITAIWPSMDVVTTGDGFECSVMAAGLLDEHGVWQYFAMSEKQRAAYLSALLECSPDDATILDAFKKIGLGDVMAKKVLADGIHVSGWDPTHKKLQEHGAKQKGQWELVTNDNYGSAKAEGWLPKEWEDDLREVSRETLELAVTEARARVEELVGDTAVDTADVERLTALANEEPPDLAPLEKAVKEREAEHAKITEQLQGIRIPDDSGFPCPHCGKPIVRKPDPENLAIHTYEKAGTTATAAEVKAIRTKIAELSGQEANLQGAMNTARTDLSRAAELANRITAAIAAVANGEAETPAGPSPEQAAMLEVARTDLSAATRRIEVQKAWQDAERLHVGIRRNARILELLAPTGLRKAALSEGIGRLNAKLDELCAATKWGSVQLNDSMQVTYNAESYATLADSEKYRVRCALQIAIALLDGSEMVIIDAAEVLDKNQRNGLLRMLQAAKIPAVVALTLNNIEAVPVLPANIGHSYWIEGGTMRELEPKS